MHTFSPFPWLLKMSALLHFPCPVMFFWLVKMLEVSTLQITVKSFCRSKKKKEGEKGPEVEWCLNLITDNNMCDDSLYTSFLFWSNYLKPSEYQTVVLENKKNIARTCPISMTPFPNTSRERGSTPCGIHNPSMFYWNCLQLQINVWNQM